MAGRIESVLRAGLCTGCGACVSDVVRTPGRMRMMPSGFLRPVFDTALTDADDRRAAAVCPAVTLNLPAITGATLDAEWGPLVQVRTGWSTDVDVRHRGSSGGGISALLIHMLESDQVDFVAHVGVSDTDPLQNVRRVSRTRQQVLAGAGSRYAPAAPMADVQALFASGERFAFVGKPCDVAALRQYLALHPQRRVQVRAVLSFMCAGVPSMRGTHEVLEALGTQAADVESFQYRGNGWPGYATAHTTDGQALRMDYNRSWGQILGRHLQLRCKLCPDGTGEFADVVCADAWYGKDGYPDFDERDGRSLVITRTPVGEALVQSAMSAKALAAEPASAAAIAGMQPYQQTRKQVVLGRWVAVLLRTGVIPQFRGLHLRAALRRGGLMPMLRNAWGTFKRVRRVNEG